MNKAKVSRSGVTIPASYIKDIERKADRLRSELNEHLVGLGVPLDCTVVLGRDITYRASADWKNQPTHHAYLGDGGCVYLPSDIIDLDSERADLVRTMLFRLIGFAEIVWELGGILTYNDDCKHTIYFEGFHF